MTITIAVGTKNPAKLDAVETAFRLLFPKDNIDVQGREVASGVSSQPMSATESITGARNRANTSLLKTNTAQFGVGLEGGLEQINGEWFDCGWCVIVDSQGYEGIASSARIPTPDSIMKHVENGRELGDAIDTIFNRQNAKQAEGHVGLFTNTLVTRTDIYTDAIIIAFSRFLHPDLF